MLRLAQIVFSDPSLFPEHVLDDQDIRSKDENLASSHRPQRRVQNDSTDNRPDHERERKELVICSPTSEQQPGQQVSDDRQLADGPTHEPHLRTQAEDVAAHGTPAVR
jgi:hypothetical protein